MAMAVAITRLDLSAAELREAAAQTQDAKAARRMLGCWRLPSCWKADRGTRRPRPARWTARRCVIFIVGNRSRHARGLTQRLMEHQAKREAGLDGDRRIDRLTAPLSGSRSMPGLNGFFGQPNREAPPPDQPGLVFRPVRHPVPG